MAYGSVMLFTTTFTGISTTSLLLSFQRQTQNIPVPILLTPDIGNSTSAAHDADHDACIMCKSSSAFFNFSLKEHRIQFELFTMKSLTDSYTLVVTLIKHQGFDRLPYSFMIMKLLIQPILDPLSCQEQCKNLKYLYSSQDPMSCQMDR